MSLAPHLGGDRRDLIQQAGEPVAVTLAATDPANAYGASLPWPRREEEGLRRPARVAGAYVVLLDAEGRVVARTDPHAARDDVRAAHPDWIAVAGDGVPRRHWDITFSQAPFEVQFNPTDYTLDKQVQFGEIPIPGLDAPLVVHNGVDASYYTPAPDTPRPACRARGVSAPVTGSSSSRAKYVARPMHVVAHIGSWPTSSRCRQKWHLRALPIGDPWPVPTGTGQRAV